VDEYSLSVSLSRFADSLFVFFFSCEFGDIFVCDYFVLLNINQKFSFEIAHEILINMFLTKLCSILYF
jgi:hypothetical protein